MLPVYDFINSQSFDGECGQVLADMGHPLPANGLQVTQ